MKDKLVKVVGLRDMAKEDAEQVLNSAKEHIDVDGVRSIAVVFVDNDGYVHFNWSGQRVMVLGAVEMLKHDIAGGAEDA